MGGRSDGRDGDRGEPPPKRELLERFRTQMLATARRYSSSSHDADDAYQRAAEILLTRSPTGTDDELCRWLRTTVKHEALAIRRQRERVAPAGEGDGLAEPRAGALDTHEQAERAERLSLGAQALAYLKPQEVRCLLLRAEGYSYREICDLTGFSYTKVNRCLTEGRQSFLEQVASIESGAECERLAPRLCAIADGEASPADLAAVRPHLRSCLACRARLREYRTVPARVAALAPPALLAAGDPDGGPARNLIESLFGAAQHKAAALGERAHQAIELAGGQKAAAVAASAAALTGGGVMTADRLSEPSTEPIPAAAEVRQAGAEVPPPPPAAAPTGTALSSPAADAAPASPAPEPDPPPPAAPRPANEFGPEAAAAAPASSPAPPPSPAPAPPAAFGPGGGGGSGGGGGEFAP